MKRLKKRYLKLSPIVKLILLFAMFLTIWGSCMFILANLLFKEASRPIHVLDVILITFVSFVCAITTVTSVVHYTDA